MYLLRLYQLHIKMTIKAAMQFKVNFRIALLSNVVTYLIMYMQLWIITQRFPTIGGWRYEELILLLAMQFFSYAIANTMLYGVLHNLETYINNGELDRMLLRPIDPVFSIVWKEFNWTGISQIALSGVVLGYGLVKNQIEWSLKMVIIIIISIIGAVLLQCGVFLIFGASAFWIKKSTSLSQMLFFNFSSFINYPLHIFGKKIMILLSTILPWAYINYYPTAKILNKEIEMGNLYMMTPVLGGIALVVGILCMKKGIANYESVGN